MLHIIETSIDNPDAKDLILELNHRLYQITGDDGTTSFHTEDVKTEKSLFLIAYLDGVPYGCGALRKISDNTAEIKRVYARRNNAGVGRAIINQLEEKAIEFGYTKILLETRKQNEHAIHFYTLCGYLPCPAYGKYCGKENAYCFEKELMK
ncbi:MAG: GNAT family N-acetyltransferase [Lachnospiraceae bacterium]|nr:GNAT family N-acetyltransferase [Lachnospiraceae bacterium]